MNESSDSNNSQYRHDEFNRRLCILTTLHVVFITVLFCAGFVGIGLFSFIAAQPIRWCPKLNNIFITYWLCLSLSILEVLLGIFFLIWLVFVTRPNKSFATLFGTNDFGATSPGVFDQLRRSTSVGGSTENVRRNYPRLSSASPSVDIPSLPTSFRHARSSVIVSSPSSSVDAKLPSYGTTFSCCWRGTPCSSQRRSWWLGLAGILLALLAAGLILCLVLVVNHATYVTTDLTTDLTSLLVEAKQNPTSSPLDNVFDCWNDLQFSLHCCGISNYTDWLTSPSQNVTSAPHDIRDIPEACFCHYNCPAGNSLRMAGGQFIHSPGCLKPVVQLFESQLLSVKVYLGATLSVLLLAFLMDVIYIISTAQATLNRLHRVQLRQTYLSDTAVNQERTARIQQTSLPENP